MTKKSAKIGQFSKIQCVLESSKSRLFELDIKKSRICNFYLVFFLQNREKPENRSRFFAFTAKKVYPESQIGQSLTKAIIYK